MPFPSIISPMIQQFPVIKVSFQNFCNERLAIDLGVLVKLNKKLDILDKRLCGTEKENR